jgi:hypothetical protein
MRNYAARLPLSQLNTQHVVQFIKEHDESTQTNMLQMIFDNDNERQYPANNQYRHRVLKRLIDMVGFYFKLKGCETRTRRLNPKQRRMFAISYTNTRRLRVRCKVKHKSSSIAYSH